LGNARRRWVGAALETASEALQLNLSRFSLNWISLETLVAVQQVNGDVTVESIAFQLSISWEKFPNFAFFSSPIEVLSKSWS